MTKETPYKATELYKFLMSHLPSAYVQNGTLDTKRLAADLGYTRWHLYRHVTEDRMPVKLANAMLKLSRETTEKQNRGRITPELLIRFVLDC